MLRIGFVGAGFMGQLAHLRNYDRVENCDVVALAEPRERLRERVATRYEIGQTYDTHADLLDGADVDAVVAAQPFQRHEVIVPDILEEGLPLFTEKPLAVAPETGEHLAELAAEHDTFHMVGYHKRSDPAMAYAKETVEEWRETGEVGEFQYVRITMPGGDWVGGAPAPVTTDEEPPDGEMESPPAEFGEDVGDEYVSFINFYIHQVNAFRFFMGDYAVTHADGAGQAFVAETDDGVTGVLEMDPYSTSDDWQEELLVGFEDGYVRVDLPAPLEAQTAGSVEVMHDGGEGMETRRPAMPATSAMRAQAENFVAAARGERDPPCDSHEAVADLRTAAEYVRMRY
jgi:predicted dehydrogenase